MIRPENVSETVALFRVAGLFVLVSFTGPFCLRVVFSWLVERGGATRSGDRWCKWAEPGRAAKPSDLLSSACCSGLRKINETNSI